MGDRQGPLDETKAPGGETIGQTHALLDETNEGGGETKAPLDEG